ncbi:hypothetical protein A6M13_07015 [Caryophanon tenue]|uniref:Restriction endonuclease n=1 Tax=Caryophanon tenue TaxID=33978 RepID=A0A1C0Y679_9BACL|nr:hypothetical protein A6M13_07015 [Caryophanon tenue]
MEAAIFRQIEQFIEARETSEDAGIHDFLTLSSRRGVGKMIRVKSYVGVLQISDDVQLEILPKIHRASTVDARKAFLHMLRTLHTFSYKMFYNSTLHIDNLPIFEVFIHAYIEIIQRLVKHGLKCTYNEVEDNLYVMKGKINFSKHLQKNFVHQERFFVQYDEYNANRPENRLIKTTLHYLIKHSSSNEHVKQLRLLLRHFDHVPHSRKIKQDFNDVSLQRDMKHYELALSWANVFLQQQSFSAFQGQHDAPALLFPMEKLFESYVGHLVQQEARRTGWHINLQDNRYYLFERSFALRPDIVLTKGTRTIVMDAKWKLLSKTTSKQHQIAQADMYQMYAYAKKYNAEAVYVIYPLVEGFDVADSIQFISDDGVIVYVQFLDILENAPVVLKQSY